MAKSSTNTREKIARRLENAILTGRLKPGARLPAEIKMARELGVSQASVREALQDLEAQGLIVKYRNRSAYVIALDSDDLANIHQVRRELEPLAVAMATVTLNATQIAALQDCIAQMRRAAESQDKAGTAILFKSATVHGLTRRDTENQRRILQIYFGHQGHPELSQVTIVPPRLWRDHTDAETRRFFSKRSRYSRLMHESMGLSLPDSPVSAS